MAIFGELHRFAKNLDIVDLVPLTDCVEEQVPANQNGQSTSKCSPMTTMRAPPSCCAHEPAVSPTHQADSPRLSQNDNFHVKKMIAPEQQIRTSPLLRATYHAGCGNCS